MTELLQSTCRSAKNVHYRCPDRYEIDVEDVAYLRHGDSELLARIYRPRGTGPFPMMIDLHGGAWCNGDRHNDKLLCEALARSGVVVAALDFRQPPTPATRLT